MCTYFTSKVLWKRTTCMFALVRAMSVFISSYSISSSCFYQSSFVIYRLYPLPTFTFIITVICRRRCFPECVWCYTAISPHFFNLLIPSFQFWMRLIWSETSCHATQMFSVLGWNGEGHKSRSTIRYHFNFTHNTHHHYILALFHNVFFFQFLKHFPLFFSTDWPIFFSNSDIFSAMTVGKLMIGLLIPILVATVYAEVCLFNCKGVCAGRFPLTRNTKLIETTRPVIRLAFRKPKLFLLKNSIFWSKMLIV